MKFPAPNILMKESTLLTKYSVKGLLHFVIAFNNTLIAPYLNYCNIAWSSRDTIAFKKLFRVQKRALCLITGKSWQTHSAPLFKSMRILRLHDINTVQDACFVYGVTHNTLPAIFHNLLSQIGLYMIISLGIMRIYILCDATPMLEQFV